MYTGYGDNAHPDFSVSIPFPIERVGECWSWPKRLLLPHGLFRPSGYSDIHGVFVHHTRTYNLQNHKIKHLFQTRVKVSIRAHLHGQHLPVFLIAHREEQSLYDTVVIGVFWILVFYYQSSHFCYVLSCDLFGAIQPARTASPRRYDNT